MEGSNQAREIAIQTLRQFSFLVFEISANEIITGVWSKDPAENAAYQDRYLNTPLVDAANDKFVDITRQYLRHAFETGEQKVIEYHTVFNDIPSRLLIRIMPAPYDHGRVLSVIEVIKEGEKTDIVEDKWRIALDATGDGMWDLNTLTGKIFFSQKWHEIFGYSETDITEMDQWNELIHPDDLPAAKKQFDLYLQGLEPAYTAELRYRCKDGSYKWILSRGVIAAYTDDGKPYRFIGTHKDINIRKLQEKQVEESEKKYKILFSYSEAMICTHDLEGKLTTINPFINKALGYTQEDLLGKSLADIMPANVRHKFYDEYLPAIKTKGTAEGIMHILTKTQEPKILLYKNYLFSDTENQPYIIGFAQDITERIAAEEELKKSVDTFSSAFNHSGVGMALVSPDGKWLQVNDVLCDITGYSKNELMGLTFQDITHPDDLETDLDMVNRILNREMDKYTLEKRYIAKDGKVIWISLTVSLVWNKDNTPRFFISQMVDITSRKTLTNELFKKNSELEAAQQSLINKIGQLEELSYIIAHNLRGPVNNINMLTEILKVKNGGNSTDENALMSSGAFTLDEVVTLISDAGSSLNASLESLLNIAQIRINKDIPLDDCDFVWVLEHVISQLKGDIVEKNVTILKDIEIAEIKYPRPYLESILYNLISNAIKYRDPKKQPVITVTTGMDKGRVFLSVKDNGLGLDLERYGNRIFKLNQVFHNHHDSKGIGLYMIKTQIEAMGGKIDVRSKEHEGTEFIVTF